MNFVPDKKNRNRIENKRNCGRYYVKENELRDKLKFLFRFISQSGYFPHSVYDDSKFGNGDEVKGKRVNEANFPDTGWIYYA